MWCLPSLFGAPRATSAGSTSGSTSTASRRSSGRRETSMRKANSQADERKEEEEENSNCEPTKKKHQRIEKQIRKDKRVYRGMHRLQLLGLQGSGKSTLVRQMRLYNGYDRPNRSMVEIEREEMRNYVKDTLVYLLRTGPESSDLRPLHASLREWILTETRKEDFRLDSAFYDCAQELWKSDKLKEHAKHLAEHESIEFFLDNLHRIRQNDFLPNVVDRLRRYVPSAGIIETDIKVDDVLFRMIEVQSQRGDRWLQFSDDVVAVIFVADVSAFDVMETSCEGSTTRLQRSLDFFRAVWTNEYLEKTSVILFLNKIDQLEQKVRGGKICSLSSNFPSFNTYRMAPDAVSEADWTKLSELQQLVLKAKCFVRHLFLNACQDRLTPSHQCYVQLVSALDSSNIGFIINTCCRDILQRLHLRRHEII